MKINKVLLIHSAHHAEDGSLVKANRFIDRLTVANVAELALPLLAALTPDDIEVEKVEDYFEDIPFDTNAEVIGISAQVMQLSRVIELAKAFKQRGKIVVLGGFLPSMHPEAVEEHVDALCIGEGDLIWPRMLEDITNGTLKKIYRSEQPVDVTSLPIPKYKLIKRERMISYPVQATRGCPFTCEYCSIIQLYTSYRLRPVEQVIRDIRAIPSKYMHFTDDNLMENRKYSKNLFRAMKKMKVIWGAQVTINVARDREMLKLAYQAGCRMLALGVESLEQANLLQVSKGFTKVDEFSQSFKTIQDTGIGVHALIVFGLPHDKTNVFERTVDYLEQQAVAITEFFIYTPYPGTPEGKRILKEGRINDLDLNHYRESYVVFDHPHMTKEEIIKGYWYALNRFYSLRSIISRMWRGTFKNKFLHLIMNLSYWIKVKRKIIPVYFGKGN